MPPPFFWGGAEKFLVRHSKVMSKTSLNPENHAYISNGMTSTPPLATCSRKVVAPFCLPGFVTFFCQVQAH